MKKGIIGSITGLVIVLMLVAWSPWKEQSTNGGFTDVLRHWGKQQGEVSEDIASDAVSGVEGNLVGKHQIDGANWSIPNIIKHLLGED